VDKTASHIGKRGSDGAALEDKLVCCAWTVSKAHGGALRIRQKGAARFNFINANDPYHPYYQHQLAQVRSGVDIATQQATQQAEEQDDGKPKVDRPPPFDFLIETPKVDPVDL
jgi:hypothetical protein